MTPLPEDATKAERLAVLARMGLVTAEGEVPAPIETHGTKRAMIEHERSESDARAYLDPRNAEGALREYAESKGIDFDALVQGASKHCEHDTLPRRLADDSQLTGYDEGES